MTMCTPVRDRLPEKLRRAFSQLGVGAAQFGNVGKRASDQDCEAVVETAFAQGLRFFDTAPHYGLGLSERRLGKALQERDPKDYVISTKVGRLLRPNPHPNGSDEHNGFLVPDDLTRIRDYTAEGVRRSLEESLKRLGLESVDILWIHDPEGPDDRFEEAMAGAVPALNRLKAEGLISAWGVGSKDSALLKRFVDEADPDLLMLAGRYTLLEQEEIGLMSACQEKGIGVVAVGIFNSGILARSDPPEDVWYEYGPAPAPVLHRARRLAAAAADHGIPLPAAALAFPGRHPAMVNTMVGMRTAEHVERNLNLLTIEIPEEFWTDLQARGLLKEDA